MAVISQYQVVIPGQTITAALWNGMELNIINNGLIPGGIEDYSSTDGQMQTVTDPFPASAISRPTSLAGELERIRWQLDNIIGGTYWYEDPPVDITSLKTNFDAHTHDGTANNGPQIQAGGLASDAVTTAKILDANVTDAKLASNAVTTVKIADSNVTTAKIADSNVTTAKIADSNVTTIKIADNNVTTAKILDANVTGAKIAPTYTISTRPAFLAYNSAIRSNVTGNDSVYYVPFNTEIFDQGSNYNNSTYIFTAPVSGIYIFNVNVSFICATSGHNYVGLILETTARTYGKILGSWSSTNYNTIGFMQIAYLSASDTAKAYVRVPGSTLEFTVYPGDASSILYQTYFGGALLF